MSDWHNVGGNIMSLLYGENYTGDEDTFPNDTIRHIFHRLFQLNTKLLSAKDLILPVKILSPYYCYSFMFNGCSNLVDAPELTATTITGMLVYTQMFQNCTSLKKAPKIHASLISDRSMETMFIGCTSLEEAPYVLPAIGHTDVRKYSWYYYLFLNCTSLKKSPIIPISTPRMNTLQQMFQGCTSLEEVKCLATDVSYNNCTANWLNNVAANGTFIKHPDMNSWGSGASGIPSGWTVVDGVIYDSPVTYLESTLGSYVETGITPNKDYRFECEFKLKGTLGPRSHYVFGSGSNATTRSVGLLVSDNGNSFLVHYNGEAEIGTCTTDTWYKIVQDKNDITIYNEDSTINATYQFGTTSLNPFSYQMLLFAFNNYNTPILSPQPVEIRKFKMIDGNGNTVADYIPARIGDFGFFYDKVTHSLRGRSGWGGKENFTFGEDILEGAIPFPFSVSASKQVYFSKGNLQWSATGGGTTPTTHATADGVGDGTWRFADNQWDFVGNRWYGNVYGVGGDMSVKCDNTLVSQSYQGWIDMFSWGSSGYNGQEPYIASTLSGQSITATNYDHGVYNAISNGGNQPGLWRLLTNDEWIYLLNTRSTPSGIRYAKANIDGLNGLIIVPDTWDISIYALSDTNTPSAAYTTNNIPIGDWIILENAGCVFIFAEGQFNVAKTAINNLNIEGWQRSSTIYWKNQSYCLFYKNDTLVANYTNWTTAGNGTTIRLVHDIN